jgi:hypothetical protein
MVIIDQTGGMTLEAHLARPGYSLAVLYARVTSLCTLISSEIARACQNGGDEPFL